MVCGRPPKGPSTVPSTQQLLHRDLSRVPSWAIGHLGTLKNTRGLVLLLAPGDTFQVRNNCSGS